MRLLRNRRFVVAVQLTALAALLAVLGWALRDVWADAAPLLRHADLSDLALAMAILAAYYLVFVLGWLRILAASGIRIPYRVALQAEMLSMLAKYVPGGVWTPAARVVALRRFGVRETPVVLASVLLEAGLSAVAGIGVFLVGLAIIGGGDAPLLPLLAFGLLVLVLLHPRVFRPMTRRLLRPFGTAEVVPLPMRTALSLVAFYALTWPLGGAALFFLLRSVGGDPAVSTIPVSGRRERGRSDRRRARRLRAVGPRRARGVDVRPAPRRDQRGGCPGRDDPQPARDHDCRGGALARRHRAPPLAARRAAGGTGCRTRRAAGGTGCGTRLGLRTPGARPAAGTLLLKATKSARA